MAKDAVVALNRLGHLDLTEFYQQQLKSFEQQEVERFAKEGPGWTALSPRYADWKARRYPGKGILRASDRLYKSLTGDSPDAIRKATDKGMQFGSSVPYANRHNKGSRGMPKREFLRFDLQRVTDDLRKFVAAQVDGDNNDNPTN